MTVLTATPTAFETLPDTMYLVATIDAAASSCIINYVPLAITSGIIIIDEGTPREERCSFGAVADNGNGTATLSDMRRALAYGGGTAYEAAQATAYEHTGNAATVRLVIAHEFLNAALYGDRNSTLNSGIKLLFGDTDVWIYGDGTELYLKSATTAQKTLAQLAALSGSDEKVKVSIDDTTSDYLINKVAAGDGIALTETNGGANEDLTVSLSNPINFKDATELTIASDAVTRTQTLHSIDTESDAATDNLATISGGAHGDVIIIFPASASRVVTVKDATGNIHLLAGDYIMSSAKCSLTLRHNGTNWIEVARTSSATGIIAGDGSDGDVTWTSSTNLNPAGQFNYVSATLDAGQTLSVSSVNSVLVINSTRNVTINGTVDLNGKGGAGGAGGAGTSTNPQGNGSAGSAGTAGASLISGFSNGASSGGGGGVGHTTGAGGGGGGAGGPSIFTDTAAATAGTTSSSGTGGTAGGAGVAIDGKKYSFLHSILRGVVCGSGGSGGGGGGKGDDSAGLSAAGGAGGAGGGALIWFIGGNLTLGASSVIRCAGAAGTVGGNSGGTEEGAGGGGGGGGGGTIVIVVAGSITNAGATLSAAAGAAANGGTGGTRAGAGGAGSAGADGKVVIYSLADGSIIVS